jgi:DNA polymerase elongation subunit (family B)
MAKHYTNVLCQGNYILYRGVNNGKKVKSKVTYTPSLFVKSKKAETEYKGIHGESLDAMRFESIRAAKEFQRKYKDVDNFDIYGMDRFEYAYMADSFKGQIEWNIDDINVSVIDIEVSSQDGFPDPYEARAPITAICIRQLNGNSVVFGCRDYDCPENVTYIKCENEHKLCMKFVEYWQSDYPDVISGWNTDFFDIPYLVNRFRTLFGDDFAKKLSPWNNIWERKVVLNGRELISYHLSGINSLDYIELYKWYAPGGKSQESYKLDAIANVELGERKLSYDEYDNLHNLYQENYQKFIDYNIKDVDLIIKLEGKLKLIELALTLAYDTKTNFEDVFAQTRMWDSLIYNHLLPKKIIVPPKKFKKKVSAFEGAYVKEPQVGMHDWVASFDLNSLYPHLLIMYNISPETIINAENYTEEMQSVLKSEVNVDSLLDQKIDTKELNGVTLTPNGQFFRTDKQGFLPKMMEEMYVDRKKFKNLMIQAQKDYEKNPSTELSHLISRYNNLQLAKKVSLNSAYGALGSQYFRFYDLRQALAVTLAGQLSIRWIENKLNTYMNDLLNTKEDYVVASDTDSIYLKLGNLIDKVFKEKPTTDEAIKFMDKVCDGKIQSFIDKSYKELADYVHAYDQKMVMKREALADKGLWTAKKRYVLNVYDNEGVRYTTPKLKIMGLEMIKSSTPYAIREKMKELTKIIVTKGEDEVQEFIAKFKEEFKSLPPEEISFPRGCNGLKTYEDSNSIYKKGTPIHVRGALLYNHQLKKLGLGKKYPAIQSGEKLKFTYLKQPNPLKDNVISFPTRIPKEFGLEKYIDFDTQFQKGFIEPTKFIVECIGWEIEKSNSLESFFG